MSGTPEMVRFALVRVDDRLLHGQVVYGWGGALAPHVYRIVDDQAAGDEWTADALRSATGDAEVVVESVDDFASAWRRLSGADRTIVLLRDLATLDRLLGGGFRPADSVNLGGIRRGAGARSILPYLQLATHDVDLLCDLLRTGFPLFAQDLPGGVRYDAQALRAMLDC